VWVRDRGLFQVFVDGLASFLVCCFKVEFNPRSVFDVPWTFFFQEYFWFVLASVDRELHELRGLTLDF